jgi:hypothetical protein
MPRRQFRELDFPVKGIVEGLPYEDQPPLTTVDAQNVRPFPASSPDVASGLNSKASGRDRGGQRAGLSKYNSTAHTTDGRIQDIDHLIYPQFQSVQGRGDSIMAATSSGSGILVGNEGTQTGSNLGAASETYNLSAWGRDGYGYLATVNGSHVLILRKYTKNGTALWEWTSDAMPAMQLTSATRQVRGMTVWGNVLYLWLSNINGVNGEAIYRINTSTGAIFETTSGDGTQADYWRVSQDQSTAKFKDFYPTSGITTDLQNLMVSDSGMLGMLVVNNSAAARAVSTTGTTTATIDATATASTVQTALRGLSHLADDGDDVRVTCTGGPLNTAAVIAEFTGTLGLQDVAILEKGGSIAGNITIAVTQTGNAFQNTKISITCNTGSGNFTLTHDQRLSLQLIDILLGKQILCAELMAYAPYASGQAVKQTNQETDITSDGMGTFYTLTRTIPDIAGASSTYSHQVAKVTSAGVVSNPQTNAGTTRAISYDPVNGRLGAVGGNVYGSGHSFATIQISDLARINSQDPNSTTVWNAIDADETGGFRIFRNDASDNIARMTAATTPALDWVSSYGGNKQEGATCSTAYALDMEHAIAQRMTKQIAVCSGVVKEFDDENWYTVTNGGDFSAPALDRNAPVIMSVPVGQNLFFADGKNVKYFKGQTATMTTWTPTAGALPVDSEGRYATLIEAWCSRVVLAGVSGDPQEWYMSKIGDAFNWDYSPPVLAEDQAAAGVYTPAGKCPDVIRCIMPLSDDVIVFGCDHSIWQLSGNPMMGGRYDNLAEGVGTPWGRPWCQDSSRNFYIFGTRGGVYRGSIGEGITKITTGRIEERLSAINLDTNLIRLAWNERERGVHVFVTPLTVGDSSIEHYFYDVRNESWWIDKFANTNHDPTAVHIFDGDDPGDRAILLGGKDGYLRKWDLDTTDDDGTAISSHVYLGPIAAQGPTAVRLNEIRSVVAKGSSDVTMSVYRGDNPEDAYNSSSAFFTSNLTAGNNPAERRKTTAHAVYLKYGNTAVAQTWAMEHVECEYQDTAVRFARTF